MRSKSAETVWSTYLITDLHYHPDSIAFWNYGWREYFTVTAEKATKHSTISKIRNTPQSGRFITFSNMSIYLKRLRFCRNFPIYHIWNSNMNLNWIIIRYDPTVLSPGADVCSCSVVSACDGTVPLRHEPVPVPPVSHSPALLWRVSVWYPGGPLWASPAECRPHTLA
jgi:hypothetical protein